MKAHDDGDWKIVEVVIVAVHLHEEKSTDEISTFYVIVPGCKRFQPRQDFVDSFTQLHEVRVVLLRVVHRVIDPLQCGPSTIVREIAAVVGYECLRSITA